MALFEGSVAFVMIGAVMKSMDPAMEEASQVLGASRMRTMLRITLPLVLPGVLGAAVFVFAEMLGSFSAALVLGLPNRFYVVTTAMYQLVSQYPPRFPTAAAMGVSLFAVMFADGVALPPHRAAPAATSPSRARRSGRVSWTSAGCAGRSSACASPIWAVAVILPVLTITYASFQRLTSSFPRADNFTLANYKTALSLDAVRSALGNSLLLGLATASLGVVFMGFLSWLIYRSRLPGAGAIEYLLMFPQAVPRLVFAFGMLWAWLIFPIPIYGTLWLLLIAYLTVFLPLGLRTISGVILQIDRSLEESAQMCGATWGYRLRTVTMPLLKPGLIAAWLLLFIASVRELGASILLMGPKAKVITPAIVESWFSTSTELTAAMAVLQTLAVVAALVLLFAVARRAVQYGRRVSMARASIEVRDLVVRYGAVAAVRGVSFTVDAGEHLTLLGPSGMRQDHHLARDRRAREARRRARSGSAGPRCSRLRLGEHPGRAARAVDGLPVLRDLAAHERVRQRRLRPAGAQAPRGRGRDARARGARSGAARRARRAQRLEAVRRPAAARRARPRLRLLALGPSVRRAAVEPRRQAARRDARRAEGAPAPARHHLGLRHPRPRGGARDLRPDHGDARRRDRASRARPAEIYDRPRNTFVADFVGSANLDPRPAARRPRARRARRDRDGRRRARSRHAGRSADSAREASGGAHGSGWSRARAPGGPVNAWPAGSGSACSRATSRSITSTGTAGRSSCAAPPPSRWPRATRCSSAPIRGIACCWRSEPAAEPPATIAIWMRVRTSSTWR